MDNATEAEYLTDLIIQAKNFFSSSCSVEEFNSALSTIIQERLADLQDPGKSGLV